MDSLSVLRKAIKSKSSITYSKDDEPSSSLLAATHILIPPGHSFPKSSPTRYRKPGITTSDDPATNPQDYFSLEAVYLAWLLKDAPGADYMKQARENGLAVGFVSVTERKSVVDWLAGTIKDHDRIISLDGYSKADSTTPPGSPRAASPSKPSAAPMSSKPAAPEPSSSSLTKRRYVADHQDMEVVKKIKHNEVELSDRNSVLRGAKPNNFSAIRTIYSDKLKKLKESSKPGATPAPTAPDAKMQAKKAKNNFPIIMISSSPTALITMHNVKRFLQESVFETSQDARTRAMSEGNSGKADDMIPIYRKRTHIDPSGKETETQARYAVVDSVDALTKFGVDAWDRVVCVMTTGQPWQFKPYKWSDPRTLFHHVKGVYVTWANDPPNTKIKDWNVMEVKIDQNRRHVDKSVVAHFWKTLDTWTLTNKPWLMK